MTYDETTKTYDEHDRETFVIAIRRGGEILELATRATCVEGAASGAHALKYRITGPITMRLVRGPRGVDCAWIVPVKDATPDNGVVFLDFDGVLNDFAYEDAARRDGRVAIDPVRAARVNRLCADGAAGIVLVTGWLRTSTPDEIAAMLRDAGVTAPVVGAIGGMASHEGAERAAESRAWLDAHPRVNRYVVVDDSIVPWEREDAVRGSDAQRLLSWVAFHYVRPSGGITEKDADTAVEILRTHGRARENVTLELVPD